MYNKIVNPITNRSVNITSRLGKNILKNYLNFINKLGGASAEASKPVGYGKTAPSGSTCGLCGDPVTEQIWYSADLAGYEMYPWICKDCATDPEFGIDASGNKARKCNIAYNSTGKIDIKNITGKTKQQRDLIPASFTQSIEKYKYANERKKTNCGAAFLIEQQKNQGCSRYAVDTFKGKKFMLDYSRNFKNKFIRNYTNKDLLTEFVTYIENNNSKYGMRDFYIDYYRIAVDNDNINNIIIDNLIRSVHDFTDSGTTNDKNFWNCQYINVDYEKNETKRQSKCISDDNCEFSDRSKNCNLKGTDADDYWADKISVYSDILHMILSIKDIDNTNGKVIFNAIKKWTSSDKHDPNIMDIYLINLVKPEEGDCVEVSTDGKVAHAMVIKKDICEGNVIWLLLDSLAGGKQYDISDGKGQINVDAIESLTLGKDKTSVGIAGYGNTDSQQVTIKSLNY